MFERFDANRSRYASTGVVSSLPGEMIDSIWLIIDLDLKGGLPLSNLLTFALLNKNGQVSYRFTQAQTDAAIEIDLPFPFKASFPKEVFAYDDGTRQTILLPSEIRQR